MAASMRSVLAAGLLTKPPVVSCRISLLRIQQARYSQRLKQPSVAKVKEKVIPRAKEETKKPQRPSLSLSWTRKVEDDVWLRMYYPKPSYTIEEAVGMHAELAQPAMLNYPDAIVYIDMKLCMKTKKKTKFSSGITKTLILPHPFATGIKSKIAIFCNTLDEQQQALQMGASEAGGAGLVKKFLSSELSPSDYDFILCTIDTLHELIPLRTVLKDSFPNKSRATLGATVGELMHLYVNGVTYRSLKTKDEDAAVATMRVPIGKLSMDPAHLRANWQTYVQSIGGHRSPDLGPVILKASCQCPPSSEKFDIVGRDIGHTGKPVVAVQEDDESEQAKAGEDSDED